MKLIILLSNPISCFPHRWSCWADHKLMGVWYFAGLLCLQKVCFICFRELIHTLFFLIFLMIIYNIRLVDAFSTKHVKFWILHVFPGSSWTCWLVLWFSRNLWHEFWNGVLSVFSLNDPNKGTLVSNPIRLSGIPPCWNLKEGVWMMENGIITAE